MNEIWKGVIYNGVDYSEWLEISNLGRIMNPKTRKIRKQNITKTGYYFVSFSRGSRKHRTTIKVHKAIAEVFIPNKLNYPIINHKDGNKLNNMIENLEWCTYSQNTNHAIKNGLIKPLSKEKSPNSKLKMEDVIFIRENYKARDFNFGARALGRKYGVEKSTVTSIVHGLTWVL